ncbi:MAG: GNAT family protein, partial [Pseudomonadota bacterium]
MADLPTLITQRFTLRALRRSDAAALLPTLSDPEHCRYLSRPAFASEEELWGWLADPAWPGRTWIAVDEAGAVAGRFVAIPREPANPSDGVSEIGYITCAQRQREGVANECTAALITHLFARPVSQGGARKLTAEVDTRNAPSIALLERLGFTREATLREHDATHLGLCDV